MTINEITGAIITAAMKVHTALGPGLLESAYEACLAYELEKIGLHVERQKPVPVVYEDVKVDCGFRADLLVEGQVIAELKAKYKEPWATQNVISTYGDMWLMKAALEKASKADRLAVADAFRTMDGGPAKYYPGGQLKFDEKGRRVGAGVVIVQWQNGVPVTVYPSDLAQSSPLWPKKS